MNDSVKEVLRKYNDIVKLVLEQKLDEMEDEYIDINGMSDEDTPYEAYLIEKVLEETDEQAKAMENEPEEALGGKSIKDWFMEASNEELIEALEFCTEEFDNKPPESLTSVMAVRAQSSAESKKFYYDYVNKIIKEVPWTESEMDDEEKVFEMEFSKVKPCFDFLIKNEDSSYVSAVLTKFLTYPEVQSFVAETVKDYVTKFPNVTVPYIIDTLDKNKDTGLEGPFEDLVIILSAIGETMKDEEIYMGLKHAFRYMNNKIYAVICISQYNDPRAIPMLKGYVNRNVATISRELFYEIMSAVKALGGDISDIEDPFGDFDGKNDAAGGMQYNYRK